MRNTVKIFIFFIFFFIIGVFYIRLTRETNYHTTSLTNKELPQFKISYFDTNGFYTEQDLLKHAYQLINFWSSWCGPCRDEHPFLLRLKDENNINLLGVNFKDKKNNALKFLREFGNPYDLIAEDKFGKNSVNLGIYGIPESILINKDLIIIKKFIGPITEEDFKYIVTAINK
mgnify:CR=1 FL=1